MKKPLKITLIILSSIVAFILLIFLIVSLFGGCIAKNYVNNHAQDLIGRKANIDHVGVNLFTGNIAINGLTVYEENGSDKFAGFDTLDISVSLLRLVGQTVYVRHFTLAGLDVKVMQDSTRFNFSSIIEHFAKDSTEVEEEKDTTPSNWAISLHKIRLANGSANYTDVRKQSHWGFNDLTILVPDFTIGGEENTDAGLTLQLADGGSLKIDAKYNAGSNDFDASLSLTHFTLNQAKAYVTDIAKIDEIKGTLNLTAKASGNLSQVMDMTISAEAAIDNVDIIDNNKSSVASLNHLGVDVNKIVLSQNLFDIESINMNGLNARFEQFKDSTNTFSRLLIPQENQTAGTGSAETAQPDTATTDAKPMQLHLNNLALTDINVTYADHTLPTDFVFPITNLRIESKDITTSGNNNARIFANLPNGAVAIIDWNGNISQWKQHQSLKLNIKGLHLNEFNPYMLSFFGQPFNEGIFSFTSYNTINNSQLNGKNRIDIFKPTLGNHEKGVKPKLRLPLKAALYILKDKDDKVILDIPISGNIDNPEFNYMKLVWKTLGNLIVKVATSPARALGDLFSKNNDELFITIDPEVYDFTSEQFYQIDKVVELAKVDENYHLNLELQTRPTTDAAVIKNNEMRSSILQRHLTELGLNSSQFTISAATPNDSIATEGYSVTLTIDDNNFNE